jgi:hypothetical protein
MSDVRGELMQILVGNRETEPVFEVECRTPRQMQLADAFCRYLRAGNAGLRGCSFRQAEPWFHQSGRLN